MNKRLNCELPARSVQAGMWLNSMKITHETTK